MSPQLRKLLEDTCIPSDIRLAIISIFKDLAPEWIEKGLPLLEGKTPIELVASEEGQKALMTGLMRMPI